MLGLAPVTHVIEAIGGAFLLGAFFAAANAVNFLRRSDTTDGTIVRAETYDMHGTFKPVVEFFHEGRRSRADGRWGVSEKSIIVGQRVRVRFRLDRPELARVDRPVHVFATTIALAVVAVVFGAMAGCVAYVDASG
jgi:hypothetical protein